MLNLIIVFMIGLWIGGAPGFFGAALMSAGHSADAHIRKLRGE